MRTAITLHLTEKGWVLASGPDKPADAQRLEFNNLGQKWPSKSVLEVRYQQNDGVAKSKTKDKAEASNKNIIEADKKAAEKLKNAEALRLAQAEAEAKRKQEEHRAQMAANAKLIEDKEKAKKAAQEAIEAARTKK